MDGKKPESFKVAVHPVAQQVRDASSDGVEDFNNNIYSEKENNEKHIDDGKQPYEDAKLNYRLLSSTEESPSIALYNNNDESFNDKQMEEPLYNKPVHKKIIAQQLYKVKNNQDEESSSKAPVNNRPLYKAIFKDASCYKIHHSNRQETNNIQRSNVESTDKKKEHKNKSFNEVKTYYYTGSKGFRTVDEDPIGDEGENNAYSENGDVDMNWGFPWRPMIEIWKMQSSSSEISRLYSIWRV